MKQDKRTRLNISVSFTEEERNIYEYVKGKPNSSYYIKKLIKEKIVEEKKRKNMTIQEVNEEDISGMFL